MAKDWTGNKASTFKCLGASSHVDHERAPHDYYATDPKAIDGLLSVWDIPKDKKIWEPSCGEGHLSKRLTQLGYAVRSTDLAHYGYGEGGVDFLAQQKNDADVILTNPPYRYANEFVLHALELLPQGGHCVMFLKTSFLEGKIRKRKIYDITPPKYLFQFSGRIVCAINGDFESMRKVGSAVAYAWYVWEKGYKGDTTIKWI